jgi:hypothetical protein
MRRTNLRRLLLFATTIAMILAVTVAEAAKGGKPGKPGPDPGPDGVMTPVANTAYWDGAIWEETPDSGYGAMEPRNCGCGGYPNPQGSAGYVCHAGALFPLMNNLVHVDLRSFEADPVKDDVRDPQCPRLAEEEFVFNVQAGFEYWGFLPNPDDPFTSRSRSYWYGMDPTWIDGPCYHGADIDANCNVRVYTQAYFDNECIGSKCGRLIELEGWGHATPVPAGVGPLEFNPFTVTQAIEIEELTVYFRGIRRDKRVAECRYVFGVDSPVVFYTDPDPDTGCLVE